MYKTNICLDETFQDNKNNNNNSNNFEGFKREKSISVQEDLIIEYCRNLVNTHLRGEKKDGDDGLDVEDSGPMRKRFRRRRKISLTLNSTPSRKFSAPVKIKKDASNPDSLGTLLQLFHAMLTSTPNGCELKGTEDIVFQYLIIAAALRKRNGEKMNACFKRLMKDCKVFLKIYNKEAAMKDQVIDHYWGSCQQLRCGKVIVDHLDIGTETMDPIFGVLLCPYGGARFERKHFSIDEKDREAEGYHRVMFDAFDFLHRHHKTGPGADYLGALTLFEPDPLEAETTSRLFWQRQIERIREESIEVKETFF